MVKKIVVVLIAVLIVAIGKVSFAMSCCDNDSKHSSHQQTALSKSIDEQKITGQSGSAGTTDKAIEVGNKICPVMGGKINEKTRVAYEYKGKIYNFCCAGCPGEFKKNPEEYIEKIEEENTKEEGAHQHYHY